MAPIMIHRRDLSLSGPPPDFSWFETTEQIYPKFGQGVNLSPKIIECE
jgi:hypothetical protein